jgi:hypothetical protein
MVQNRIRITSAQLTGSFPLRLTTISSLPGTVNRRRQSGQCSSRPAHPPGTSSAAEQLGHEQRIVASRFGDNDWAGGSGDGKSTVMVDGEAGQTNRPLHREQVSSRRARRSGALRVAWQ